MQWSAAASPLKCSCYHHQLSTDTGPTTSGPHPLQGHLQPLLRLRGRPPWGKQRNAHTLGGVLTKTWPKRSGWPVVCVLRPVKMKV